MAAMRSYSVIPARASLRRLLGFVVCLLGLFGAAWSARSELPDCWPWTPIADLPQPQNLHAAAAGVDGRLFVIGGEGAGGPINTVLAYSPVTNTWGAVAPLPTPRSNAQAVAATNGLIYVFGGIDAGGNVSPVVEAYNPQTNTWISRSAMPRLRNYFAAAQASNGKIYVLGGLTPGLGAAGTLNTVDEYDPIANAWNSTPPANFSTPRYSFAAAGGHDGRIYAIGGRDQGAMDLMTVEAYNPPANAWTSADPLVLGARSAHGAAAGADGRIHVFGGLGGQARQVECYNPATNVWSFVAPMLTDRPFAPRGADVGGKLYVIGGDANANTGEVYDLLRSWRFVFPNQARADLAAAAGQDGRIYALGGISNADTSSPLKSARVYDPLQDTWSDLPAMSAFRKGLAAATSGFLIYALGGSDGSTLETVEAYSPAGNLWLPRASMGTKRQNFAAVTLPDDRILAIGGINIVGAMLNVLGSVEVYDPTQDAWSPAAPLLGPRAFHAAALGLDGCVYVFGGFNGTTTLETVEKYDPVTNTWTSRANMPTARSGLAAATRSDGRIFAIGGTAGGGPVDVVEAYSPRTNMWQPVSCLLAKRSLLAAARGGDGRIYAIGGLGSGPFEVHLTPEAYPAPPIVITSPNGGDVQVVNTNQAITWVNYGYVGPVNIDWSTDGGASWTPIHINIPNTGFAVWTVQGPDTGQARVRVYPAGNFALVDTSDANFTITSPAIRVLSPNGGESLLAGTNTNIRWLTTNVADYVKIEYSTNGGMSWVPIYPATENDGVALFTVQPPVTTQGRIKISQASDPARFDISDANFSITANPLTLMSPNGGDVQVVGTNQPITWMSNGVVGPVKIEYSNNGGATWLPLLPSTENDGNALWTVQGPPSLQGKIRVSSVNNPAQADVSDANFIITTNQTLRVTAPNGSESHVAGTNQPLNWTGTGLGGNVKIDYTTDGGLNWAPIYLSTPNDGAAFWTAQPPVTAQAKIRVSLTTDPLVADVSDGYFTVRPDLTLTYPSMPFALIPDGNAVGVEVPLLVQATPTLHAVHVAVNISHPYLGELEASIVHPDGTTVVLHNLGGGDQDFLVTKYPIFTLPAQTLAPFNGKAMGGTWRLKVRDLVGGNAGRLNTWAVTMVY
jgi:N-acetylneuraminic acid mutarotase